MLMIKLKIQEESLLANDMQTIFWDVDDVVLDSSEIVVDIINKKYRIPQGLNRKTVSDIKDWGLKSIYNKITQAEILDIYGSDEFWDNVQIKKGFIDAISDEDIKNKYKHVFVTKGTTDALATKLEFLKSNLDLDFCFYGIDNQESIKSEIDMAGGIQIDDNINYLKDTNSSIKILLKNCIETEYNNSINRIEVDNLYEVNYFKQIIDILKFNLKYNLLEI